MKRPIFLALVAVLIAFGICNWGFAPKDVQAPQKEAAANTAHAAVLNEIPPVPHMPSEAVAVESAQLATKDRRRIFDSPDIMATISEIRKNGTQDEKDWANYLLRSCTQLLAKIPVYSDPENEPKVERIPDSPELARQKVEAVKQLTSRCDGVKEVSPEDRDALLADLRQGSANNKSVLGQLRGIKDDRWNNIQAKLIGDALYSGDPILAKAAFTALHTAIDSDAPGGSDRLIAFQLALAPGYLNFPLSEYERLQACRSLGWCDTWGQHADATPPNPTVVRLMAQYRAAVDSHMDARGILAIR